MSILLLELAGHRELNHTPWPPRLYVYDDLLIYRKRRFFKVKEVTVSYSHIVRVDLLRGLLFASLEIVTSADENVLIKYVPKAEAVKAKKIIDQKIYSALAKHRTDEREIKDPSHPKNFENALMRLKELYAKGKISEKEFKQKRADLLRKLR
jgi:hypothetical protein